MEDIMVIQLFILWLYMVVIIILPIEAGIKHSPFLLYLAVGLAYLLMVRIAPIFPYVQIEDDSNKPKEGNEEDEQ